MGGTGADLCESLVISSGTLHYCAPTKYACVVFSTADCGGKTFTGSALGGCPNGPGKYYSATLLGCSPSQIEVKGGITAGCTSGVESYATCQP